MAKARKTRADRGPDASEVEKRLQRVLDAHSLPCGAVIAATGDIVARAGDFAAFASAGLVSALLGPYGSAKGTFDLVRSPERIKPVMWAQGDEFAVLDRAGELVIAVFGRGQSDVLARYEQSRSVGATVAQEFAAGAS